MKNSTMFFSAICFILLTLAATDASPQTTGMVKGTLTVNGKVTNLTHVRTLQTEDWDIGPNHKMIKVNVVKVFLSDVPVEDVEDDFDLSARGKEGRLHGLQLKFNKKGEVVSGTLYDKSFEAGKSNLFVSQVMFEPDAFNDKTVGGKVVIKADDFSDVKCDFNATFSAPVLQEPKPTIEGEGAASTAPAKAVHEFLRATVAKDLAALKKVLRKEFVEMLENPESKEAVMGLLDQSFPTDEVNQLKIVRVFDFGDRAWVEGITKRPGKGKGVLTEVTYRIRTLRVNGEWKVQPM
jgi:hypothetical protein